MKPNLFVLEVIIALEKSDEEVLDFKDTNNTILYP